MDELKSMCKLASERQNMLPTNVTYRFKHIQGTHECEDIGVRYSDEKQSRTLSLDEVRHSHLLKLPLLFRLHLSIKYEMQEITE